MPGLVANPSDTRRGDRGSNGGNGFVVTAALGRPTIDVVYRVFSSPTPRPLSALVQLPRTSI